ncbi:MAG: hypothetical protein QM785_08215 [Pyrinomonadaceae bacterium]
MKLLSEKQALAKLAILRQEFVRSIREGYEHKAASCLTCTTPGACCLDAHFVNVHISRLEAVAIRNKIDSLEDSKRTEVLERVENAITEYGLAAEGDTFAQKFACPLYEKGVGCLVHEEGKPAACTVHACYENAADLPPDQLQIAQEQKIDDLNARTYGRRDQWLPIPLAIRRNAD